MVGVCVCAHSLSKLLISAQTFVTSLRKHCRLHGAWCSTSTQTRPAVSIQLMCVRDGIWRYRGTLVCMRVCAQLCIGQKAHLWVRLGFFFFTFFFYCLTLNLSVFPPESLIVSLLPIRLETEQVAKLQWEFSHRWKRAHVELSASLLRRWCCACLDSSGSTVWCWFNQVFWHAFSLTSCSKRKFVNIWSNFIVKNKEQKIHKVQYTVAVFVLEMSPEG